MACNSHESRVRHHVQDNTTLHRANSSSCYRTGRHANTQCSLRSPHDGRGSVLIRMTATSRHLKKKRKNGEHSHSRRARTNNSRTSSSTNQPTNSQHHNTQYSDRNNREYRGQRTEGREEVEELNWRTREVRRRQRCSTVPSSRRTWMKYSTHYVGVHPFTRRSRLTADRSLRRCRLHCGRWMLV